jgi:hypothetical protein
VNAKRIIVLALMVMVVTAIVGGIDLINGGLVQPEIQLPSNVFF